MSKTIWLTGLSGSGKTTIALKVREKLINLGIQNIILDGDILRKGICSDLGFIQKDRHENVRRVSEISKLFNEQGFLTLCCFISPIKEMRDNAREIIGKSNFYEVFISTSVKECEKRDPKGLYKKARKGEIKRFTGISDVYEYPKHPKLIIDTVNYNVEECANQIIDII